MSHERWAKRRDEFVQTSWLRDLRSRRLESRLPADSAKGTLRSKAAGVPGLRDQRVAAAER